MTFQERFQKGWKHNSIKFILLFIFLSILFLNILYPIFSDDWGYRFVFGVTPQARVASLGDIIISQYNHYFEWGGRVVVHFIDQLLLWIGEGWHDVINAGAFVLFIFYLYKLANVGNKSNFRLLLLIYFSIWLFQPAFVETALWITGSANYLWATLIILIFLYSYILYYFQDVNNTKQNSSNIRALLFFIGGVLAGCTQENIAVTLLASVSLITILLLIERKSAPRWVWSGLFGVIIGVIILVAAPGNFLRLDLVSADIQSLSTTEVILSRLTTIGIILYQNLLYFYIIYALLLALLLRVSKVHIFQNKIFKLSISYFIAGHTALLAMAMSPVFPDRAWFVIITFFILAIFILYANIELKFSYGYIIRIGVFVLFAVPYFVDYYWKTETLYDAHTMWKERIELLEEKKAKGCKDIVFQFERGFHSKYYLPELSEYPNEGENRMFATFHGVNSVRVNYTGKEEFRPKPKSK